jgi:hemerythrin-like domain-containing protein
VLEGYEEHDVVNILMGELEVLPVDDETWGAKASVMTENIEHHIEEEEGDMFKKARQVLSENELEELGRVMEARKVEAMREQGVTA